MPSRRARRVLVVAALLGGTLAGVAQAWDVDAPAEAERPAERLDMPGPALLTSDSAWLAISAYGTMDAVQGFDHLLALASCRRRVVTSCRNYDGSVPLTSYEVVEQKGDEFEVLIQAAGYDDGDRDFVAEVDRTIWLARRLDYRRVVWVTLRENVTYNSVVGYAEVFHNNNVAVRHMAASGAYPELVVADWAEYARDRPSWFTADGIHMTRLGAYAAADYISRKMAFVESRACPNPSTPGGPIADPCPDPDVTGPVNDIAGLYPTDIASPEARIGTSEYLIFEGSGSWPDPPWWAS